MLYRAIASTSASDTRDLAECLVFFEATPATRNSVLDALLTLAWGVRLETIDAYNIVNEREQPRDWATGDESTGDARLFESGFGPDGAYYHPRERTLMFVRPATLARLVAAQELIDALSFGASPMSVPRAA